MDALEWWRPIPGWQDEYEVSNVGSIRSRERIVARRSRPQRVASRILAAQITQAGYRHVMLYRNGKGTGIAIARAMALAFLDCGGEECADHVNRRRDDDRLSNLRVATYSQNACNSKRRRDNMSGVKGVCWHRAARKWMVEIRANRRSHYLGLFATLESASAAREQATQRLHGEFAGPLV